jgi:hypothetical protein
MCCPATPNQQGQVLPPTFRLDSVDVVGIDFTVPVKDDGTVEILSGPGGLVVTSKERTMVLDSGLPALRLAVRKARLAREAAWRDLLNTTSEIDDLDRRMASMPSDANPTFVQFFNEARTEATSANTAAQSAAQSAEAAADAADAAYDTAAAAEPPVWTGATDLPLLLLPVRVETVFRQADSGTQLWIRVYPDDVHIDAHETALTPTERGAAGDYWAAVRAPDADSETRAAAWRQALQRLGPTRALWAIEVVKSAPAGDDAKDAVWTRAAQTRLMPHHFTFSGYREGRLMWRVDGAPVADELPAGFAPPNIAQTSGAAPPSGSVPWQPESRWLVDFDAAVAAGMAVRVPLQDPNAHYDFVTAVGVSTTDPTVAANQLEDLLTAHSYTSGLSVLPVGTPTNNTPGSRSNWLSRPPAQSPDDVDANRAAVAAAGAAAAATRTASALGIDGSASLATMTGGANDDHDALGAAAYGFLGRLMATSVDWITLPQTTKDIPADVAFVADHFAAHVRSRGPLPTLRVGRQPYGVLPITSIDLWRGDDVNEAVVLVLSSVLSYFKQNVYRAKRVGAGPDQDAVILDLLSRRPSSRRIRFDSDAETFDDPNHMWVNPPATFGALALNMKIPIAVRGPAGASAAGFDFDAATNPIPELLAFVAQRPLANFASIVEQLEAVVRTWTTTTAGQIPPALQAQVLASFDGLAQLAGSACGLLYQLALPVFHASYVVTSFAATAALGQVSVFASGDADRWLAALSQLRQDAVAVEAIAVTDLASVEEMLCECLDTTSHRVDAWATSLATARLRATRAQSPQGLHTGAFGWVTDLEPTSPGQRAARDGYIVTPSLQHAATATVLRSGCLAHSDPKAFAVNLTSARVRKALHVLDGIRGGQPLEYLLGYRFERGLHDRDLDVYIPAFRARYPIAPVVDPSADGTTEAQAAISARNVVDGLALSADQASYTAGTPPVAVGSDLGAIQVLVADLADTFDAVGDLLLAESVHHIVGGNPLRAGLAADAASARGALPDDYEVITTPRSADPIGYAVAALLPATVDSASDWSSSSGLAQLEPALEAWCRLRLGPAGHWVFSCRAADGSPTTVTLAKLGLGALEAVRTVIGTDSSSAAARRVLAAAGAGAAFTDDGAAGYAELGTLTEALRGVLANASPLLESHLDPTAEPWVSADLENLSDRIDRWSSAVTAAAASLSTPAGGPPGADTATAIGTLAGCGLPIPPDLDPTDPAQLATAAAHLADLVAAAKLPPHPDPPPAAATRSSASVLDWFTTAAAPVRALIGDAVPLLPRLTLTGTELANVFAPSNRPQGTDADAVDDWIRGLGRVRPNVARLTDLLHGAEVIAGAPAPAFMVTQSPVTSNPPWVAVGRADARCSCILLAENGSADVVTGVVFDSWTEELPRQGRVAGTPEEIAGIAFHSARPDARSPQTMLLAVPPNRARGWCSEDVHAVVAEAFELAQVRGLDLTDLPELRATFPPAVAGAGTNLSDFAF